MRQRPGLPQEDYLPPFNFMIVRVQILSTQTQVKAHVELLAIITHRRIPCSRHRGWGRARQSSAELTSGCAHANLKVALMRASACRVPALCTVFLQTQGAALDAARALAAEDLPSSCREHRLLPSTQKTLALLCLPLPCSPVQRSRDVPEMSQC